MGGPGFDLVPTLGVVGRRAHPEPARAVGWVGVYLYASLPECVTLACKNFTGSRSIARSRGGQQGESNLYSQEKGAPKLSSRAY